MFSVSKKILPAFFVTALLGAVFPFLASAAVPCVSGDTVLYVVAHADDALLFQNPDMQNDISAGKCVMTVFLSAGEAGRTDTAYWLAREDGSKAASALMAGVANTWTESDAGIPGHAVPMFTLDANPKVSLLFFRLPDGGVPGDGFPAYSFQSLEKLWLNSIPSITSDDGLNTYTRQNLIDALLAIMTNATPSRINTQDMVGTFADSDHSDHHATAYFVQNAHESYTTPHTLYSYVDYDSRLMPVNVTGADLDAKGAAFGAYVPFDQDACTDIWHCGWYTDWLYRRYTNLTLFGGSATINASTIGNGSITSVPAGISCGMGGSLCSASFVNGTSVTLQATPDTGWTFTGWTGACTGLSTCVLSLSGNVSVSATFVETNSCQLVTSSTVSDTSTMISGGGNAVATFVPPTWTVAIPGATWIWDAFEAANGESVTFTKEFTVTGNPTASIVIGADDSYEASLNGTQFALVADIDNFTSGNEDTYDVTALLVPGSNTLSFTVKNLEIPGIGPDLNPAGLIYGLTLSETMCTPVVVPPTPPAPTGSSGGGATPPACADGSDNDSDGKADFPNDLGCSDSLDNDETDPAPAISLVTTTSSSTAGEVLGVATEEPALPPQCTEYIGSYLGMGKKNDSEEVKKLQQFLNETLGTDIPVNGYFGSMTRKAVKAFQKKYHNEILQPWIDAGFPMSSLKEGTGYVYKTTKRWINMMKCESLQIPLPTDLVPAQG